MSKILTVKNAGVIFGEREVLRGLSLEIDAGKITALIGPNGAGKSTLLRLIAGMVTPKNGEVFLGEENITNWTMAQRSANGIGYVMHGGNVFSNLTVNENLKFADNRLATETVENRYEKINEFFPFLCVISQQRAGRLCALERLLLTIAIQMIQQPKILLLDEPSTGLSRQEVDKVYDILSNLNRRLGVSIVVAEQTVEAALQNSHRAFALSNGQVSLQSAQPADWLQTGILEQVFLKDKLKSFAKGN